MKVFFFLFLIFLSLNVNANIKVGTSPDYPPYQYYKNGKLVGFEIELIDLIFKKINLQYEIKKYDFHALFAALNAEKIDIIASSVSKTEKRSQAMFFSDCYHTFNSSLKLAFVYKKNREMKLNNILVQEAHIFAKIVKKEFPSSKITENGSYNVMMMLVENDKFDGFFTEEIVAKEIIKSNNFLSYKIFDIKQSESCNSIAVSKNNVKLLNIINVKIKELKKDGSIQKLEKKYGFYE